MNILYVDDEEKTLEQTEKLLRGLPAAQEVSEFASPMEALAFAKTHSFDAAVLDINMPEMNGLLLAEALREIRPGVPVIFLTAHPEYALDAFRLHASGYLVKPAAKEQLEAELNYALGSGMGKGISPAPAKKRITMQTFGNFEILVDGKMISFGRARAKELLAYLVDKQGSSASRKEIFNVLWEDGFYDYSMQKQLDVIIRSLRQTLKDNGISEILEMKSGFLRVCPGTFECDLYRFLEGDMSAVNTYRGVYMEAYAWAILSEADLTEKQIHIYEGK